ncbi:synaptotagmin-like protein 3 isoform X2 [Narcine bancroftii]|uniref:synaptotagmin-like protein 3 isoform X2 n=1 Tax=Narcine bancroftii TaxID=1343680 RepID=UPI003831BFA7
MNLELDIKLLHDQERNKVLEVLHRDEMLRKVEEERIRKLKSEYQEIRRKGARSCGQEYRGRFCARCQATLGLLFNKGVECTTCSHRVCRDCCTSTPNTMHSCIVCHAHRQVKVKSGEWFIEERAKKFHQEQGQHKTISENLLQTFRTLSIAIVPPTPPPTGCLLEDRHPKGFTSSMENLFWSLTDRVRKISKSHEDVAKNTQLLSASYTAKDCVLKKERSQSDTDLVNASKLPPCDILRDINKVDSSDTKSSQREGSRWTEEENSSNISTGRETAEKIDVTGEIELSIQYNFKASALEIHIKACRNLVPGDGNKKCNPYVKAYLFPDKSSHSKLKSSVKKNTVDPVFNETLQYKIPRSQLGTRTLHVSVWYNMTLQRQVFVGQVLIPFGNWTFEDSSTQSCQWYQLRSKRPDSAPEQH